MVSNQIEIEITKWVRIFNDNMAQLLVKLFSKVIQD